MRSGKTYRMVAGALLVLLFWAAGAKKAVAQDVNYKAYSVYVYNFIKYIEWPEAARTDEFVIAIVGDSPVKAELKTLAATKKANGKTIVVKQYSSIEEVGACHILYLSAGKSNALKSALERTKGLSTLVIAEREGLARKGAGINFVTLEDETLKFELNRKVIEENRLKISNQLISLALVVK